MNWLKWFFSVKVLRVCYGDVLVLRISTYLTDAQRMHATSAMKAVWPHNKIMVLDSGAELTVVRPAPMPNDIDTTIVHKTLAHLNSMPDDIDKVVYAQRVFGREFDAVLQRAREMRW